jgi:uncharacterized protein YjbJ (UPF0337 family)
LGVAANLAELPGFLNFIVTRGRTYVAWLSYAEGLKSERRRNEMGIGDKATEAKGKARDTMGRVTGSKKQQTKGKVEQVKGKAGQMVGKAKAKKR